MWTSLNDGPGSGLDADKLDNREGIWYQNALNVNKGVLSERVLPRFIDSTTYRDSLTIRSYNGDLRLRVYISGSVLNTTPFTPGSIVRFYDDQSQAAGDLQIDNLVINDDTADNFNDYTIIIGRLTSGTLSTVDAAVQIGTASNRVDFDGFSLDEGNTFEVAKLESDSGTANLRLGRSDGQATSPAIYFTSAQLAPSNYNAAIIATGGNASDGSGTLNALVANSNGFNINGNVIWNAGNIQFQSTNVANTAVLRDANGDFAAGTITANVTGASSLNVLKAGDTMTGSLTLTGAGSNLTVSGITTLQSTVGITDDLAVDTDTLFVDVSTDRVGINAGVNPRSALDVVTASSQSMMVRNQYTTYTGIVLNNSTAEGDYNILSSSGDQNLYLNRPSGNSMRFRENNSDQLFLNSGGYFGINGDPGTFRLSVGGTSKFTASMTFENTSAGQLNFYNNSATRYWRVGSNTQSNNFFTFESSDAVGNTNFTGSPALGIDGVNNAVTINTTDTSGVDPTDGSTVRNYKFNVQGDVNFNGQLFQNNAEFVTSRWTEASNGADIYRLSRVGINKADPTYQLHVLGSANIEGQDFVNEANNRVLYANGIKQWIDTYGTFKTNRNFVDENITVPAGYNAMSAGPITINNNIVITIADGAAWTVV